MKTIHSQIFVTIFVGWLALSQNSQAVFPPPDGGYPGFTTAEGTKALQNLSTGIANSAFGWYSLFSDSTASYNTGVGAGALALNIGDNNTATGAAALLLNTTGFSNTANGFLVLLHNDSGGNNTGVGAGALGSNTTGNANTAVGVGALSGNIDGNANTATGVLALSANTHGLSNTAAGLAALQNNITGSNNTAIGAGALTFNNADNNTACGNLALMNNSTGVFNSALGQGALASDTTGDRNTASGAGALFSNTSGQLNVAVGFQALNANTGGSANTAVGKLALLNNTTGTDNIGIGNLAGQNLTTGQSNVDIANDGVAGEERTIRIGSSSVQIRTFIAAIRNAPITGTPVVVSADDQLGIAGSSRRFKSAIKPMDKASEVLLALKPVTFRYKKEIDPAGTSQYGLVAEQVEKVNPDLVVRDKEGKPYTVRYDAVNAMLLNEFLKEHDTVLELKKEISALIATVKEQSAQIQKVTAQIETSKATSQMVLNGQ